MNVWKIASRWSDTGTEESAIIDIFRKYNIVFAGRNTDYIKKSVKKDDLIAVTDGITVVCVGRIKEESKILPKFNAEDFKSKQQYLQFIKELEDKEIPIEKWITAIKVDLHYLQKKERFDYTRGTFHKIHGTYRIAVIKLFNKRENFKNAEVTEFDRKLKKNATKDFFANKDKILDSCIKQIHIENYQAIKELNVSDIPIDTQWIFLTGENGYGKTSVLRAIMVGLQGKELFEPDKNPPEGTFIEFKASKIQDNNHVNIIGEDGDEFFIKFSNFANLSAYGAKRTELRDTKEISEIHENLFEKNETALINFEIRYKDWRLFPDINSTKIKNFEKLLKLILPNLSKIDIEPKKSEVVYFELSESNKELAPVLFHQLAMGMRSIIAMIADMVFRFTKETFDFNFENYATDLSGIVIIDEFDNHLHPKWQRMLVKKLTNLFPKVQFIVSTHSPIAFLGAPKNSVFIRVNRNKESGIIAEILDIDVSKLTPNSILTSPIFGFEDINSTEVDIEELETADRYSNIENEKRLKKKLNILKQSDEEFFNSLMTE